MEAYKLVKENAGAAGIDKQTLDDFDKDLKGNLYKLWNRMSSGSYLPPPVKAVPIPKKQGGVRILGIPTVTDRIAQMVVKLTVEPSMEPYFLRDSYGYRPNKSALQAIGVTRQRCWQYNWVLEFDIKGLFDNIDHELLMKAVRGHTNDEWAILYIERWLKAPMQQPNGDLIARTKGTPQGGVVSPLLSNLFLHYAYDKWMCKHHPTVPWCRYADDGLAHLESEKAAQQMLESLKRRFEECLLELHPEKTKIVYCKDEGRKQEYCNTEFNFLGYCFRQRWNCNSKTNRLFLGFNPAVSKHAVKAMQARTQKSGICRRTDLELEGIAKLFNPVLQGWINYYGYYHGSALYPVLRHFNRTLISWAIRKYKQLRRSKTRAARFLEEVYKRQPDLFAHWKMGMKGAFA